MVKLLPFSLIPRKIQGPYQIEVDVSQLAMGDMIDIYPYEGKINKAGKTIANFQLKSQVLLDEVQAGGRINLIIGRNLTRRAREALGLGSTDIFRLPKAPKEAKSSKGFTLAQKMVGRACGLPEGEGIRPGTYCEPMMTSVGSQDTTGPMTRDELKDLACIGFQADLVMQSFCHTAAYPKLIDLKMQQDLPLFMTKRNGNCFTSRRRHYPFLA